MLIAKPQPYLTNDVIPLAAINTGDLLGWAGDHTHTFGDKSIKMIRFFTQESFGHVGIAVRMHDWLDDELLVVEATIPKIKLTRLTTDQVFYCVPMGVPWTTLNKSFLMSKLGLKYSVMDAVRAGVGMHVSHDLAWQCAELAHGFYEASGVVLPDEFTPGALIKNAIRYSGNPLMRVIGPGRTIDFTGKS